jgi:flagellar biosynthesis/type III secretory pathway protein FliH
MPSRSEVAITALIKGAREQGYREGLKQGRREGIDATTRIYQQLRHMIKDRQTLTAIHLFDEFRETLELT